LIKLATKDSLRDFGTPLFPFAKNFDPEPRYEQSWLLAIFNSDYKFVELIITCKESFWAAEPKSVGIF
jgi:hypothetical protein